MHVSAADRSSNFQIRITFDNSTDVGDCFENQIDRAHLGGVPSYAALDLIPFEFA